MPAQADFAFLMKLVSQVSESGEDVVGAGARRLRKEVLRGLVKAVPRYANTQSAE